MKLRPISVVVAAATFSCLMLSASAAPAADIPTCPANEETLDTGTPEFLRVGKSFSVWVESGEGSNITVRIGEKVIPLTQDESGEATVISDGPSKLGKLKIVFSWDQSLGTPAACHGTDSYSLLVIAAKGRAGNPSVGRLTGSYDVSFKRSGEKTAKARWALTPGCEYFGCTARLKSNGGFHGLLKLRDRHYKFSPPTVTSGYCDITSLITGEKRRIAPLVHVSQRVDIKPTKVVNGIVKRFAGTRVNHYVSTTRADNAGCGEVDTEERYKITGARR